MANFFKFGSLAADTTAPGVPINIKAFWAIVPVVNHYSHIIDVVKGAVWPMDMTSADTNGYKVPVGKTLYITRIRVPHRDFTNANMAFALLYGDTDVGGDNAGAPAVPKTVVGHSNLSLDWTPFVCPSSAENGIRDFSVYLSFPSAKYPTVYSNTGIVRLYMEGFEA